MTEKESLTSSEIFAIAAKKLIELHASKHGAQKRLAKKLGIHPTHLSALIAGKRVWSDRIRDKFAKVLGLSIADIYAIGEDLHTTGCFFPYARQIRDTQASSEERFSKIFFLVSKEFKLDHIKIFTSHTLATVYPDAIKDYKKGKTKDPELCDFARMFFRYLLKNYIS